MAEENILDNFVKDSQTDLQRLKDELVDDLLRRMNKFTSDWNRVLEKKMMLEQSVRKTDKLNDK
jgi:hypothetical protein